MVYIHEENGFWHRETVLQPSFKIGTTLEDYEDGAYLLLNAEQEQFYNDHPDASQVECWNMALTPKEEQPVIPVPDPVETARSQKIWSIIEYDRSGAVNGFIVNGISTWLTPDVRANYKNSIEAAELLGESNITFIIAGITATSALQEARIMLAKIQRYADRCTIVTETHKANVNSLSTVQEIEAYDYMVGYPEKEEFIVTPVQGPTILNSKEEVTV